MLPGTEDGGDGNNSDYSMQGEVPGQAADNEHDDKVDTNNDNDDNTDYNDN